jgi:uncharacterized tellurite resistance protein B-like protein
MNPIQNLYYALGQMAYAIAFADGKVQKEEMNKLEELVQRSILKYGFDAGVIEIIFKMLHRDQTNVKTVAQWSEAQLNLNSAYLSEKMKKCFLEILNDVALAYPPVTNEEKEILNRYQSFLASLKGDPVFTGE